jgi:GT2 family glycosyltransferase
MTGTDRLPADWLAAPRGTESRQHVPLCERLTVVLLTYNCAHRIDAVLDHLIELRLPLIAVDNSSSDDTVSVLRARPQIDVVISAENIGAAGRNLGAARVRTPYVAFCDDDGWYEPDGMIEAVDLLDRYPQLAVLNARILVGEHDELDGISAEMAASPVPDRAGIPGPVLLSFMAGAAVFRLTAYQQVGGYDPMFFMGGEEETLAHQLARRGWQMRYLPSLVMHHYPSVANAPRLRAHGMRNTIWNAWLHRRFRSAVRHTLFILADTPKNRDWLRGIGLTLRGMPTVLRSRRPIDRTLDADLRLLDDRRHSNRRPLFNRVDPVLSLPPSTAWRRPGSEPSPPVRRPSAGGPSGLTGRT